MLDGDAKFAAAMAAYERGPQPVDWSLILLPGSYIEIPLTKGFTAVVSPEDQHLCEFKWTAQVDFRKHKVYARRDVGPKSNRIKVYMHRQVLQVPQGLIGDHRYHRLGLDNRRCNLRVTSPGGNIQNAEARCDSGYKGVVQVPSGAYRARISFKGNERHIGTYRTAEEAARAYDAEAVAAFGIYAWTNFPTPEQVAAGLAAPVQSTAADHSIPF